MRKNQYRFRLFYKLAENFPLLSALIFFLIALTLFATLIFGDPDTVISRAGNNLTSYNAPSLIFGFREIARGNIPLWNPYILCGSPFFGNFSSALLYPPNWIHLLLPAGIAINFTVALHVFLAGWLTTLWARNFGLPPTPSITSGIIYMMSGAYFFHVYPGDLQILDAAVWIPLVFLCLDKLGEGEILRWLLCGIFAVSMQVLSGGEQIAYYTAMVGVLYSALRNIPFTDRLRSFRWFALIYVGAAIIAAIQILPGFQAVSESIRPNGTSYDFASAGSFPIENLFTMISPWLLGDMESNTYFGRSQLWEVCMFVGISALILMVYGIVRGERSYRRFLWLIAFCFILALGRSTPLHRILFHLLPQFGNFCDPARFNIFTALFMALFAGVGFTRLLQRETWPRGLALVAAITAVLFVCVGILLRHDTGWTLNAPGCAFLNFVGTSPEHAQEERIYSDLRFLERTRHFAGLRILMASLPLTLFAAICLLSRFHRSIRTCIVGVLFVELFVFAYDARLSGPINPPAPPVLAADYKAMQDSRKYPENEYRILTGSIRDANRAMPMEISEIYGLEPLIPKRYAEFLAFTQEINLAEFDQKKYFPALPMVITPMDDKERMRGRNTYYSMLSAHFLLGGSSDQGLHPITTIDDPLTRLTVIRDWETVTDRDDAFKKMNTAQFNPRAKVFLESAPNPGPTTRAASSQDVAIIVKASTDFLELKASIPSPAILLINNSYSRYWRARAMEPGPQSTYTIQPANYTLCAIPLAKGAHHIRLDYAPSGYFIGKWITVAGLLAYAYGIYITIKTRRPTGRRFRM